MDAGLSAIIGSIFISVVTKIFTWYLGSGLSTYNLVYGSLGAIVALLFWIYLISLIIFSGAHLGAAISHVHRDFPEEMDQS
jgi:membrane protein